MSRIEQRNILHQREQRLARIRLVLLVILIIVALAAAGIFAFSALGDKPSQIPAADQIKTQLNSSDSANKVDANKYTVLLDLGNNPKATVPENSLQAEKGQKIKALPIAKSAGQRFSGWYTGPESDAGAQLVDNSKLELIPTDQNTTLYARFAAKPEGVDKDVNGVPVLMYHYFYDPEKGEGGEDANWMNLNLFKQQVQWLTSDGWYFPTWDEMEAFVYGEALLPPKSIILTSDDGFWSFFSQAIPVVEEHNAKITGFVETTYFQDFSFEEYRSDNVFFQSHSYDFHHAGSDGKGAIMTASEAEIIEDANQTERVLGTKQVLAYPFGHNSASVQAALAKAGVKMAFTVEPGLCYPGMNPLELPRVRMSDGISLDAFIARIS